MPPAGPLATKPAYTPEEEEEVYPVPAPVPLSAPGSVGAYEGTYIPPGAAEDPAAYDTGGGGYATEPVGGNDTYTWEESGVPMNPSEVQPYERFSYTATPNDPSLAAPPPMVPAGTPPPPTQQYAYPTASSPSDQYGLPTGYGQEVSSVFGGPPANPATAANPANVTQGSDPNGAMQYGEAPPSIPEIPSLPSIIAAQMGVSAGLVREKGPPASDIRRLPPPPPRQEPPIPAGVSGVGSPTPYAPNPIDAATGWGRFNPAGDTGRNNLPPRYDLSAPGPPDAGIPNINMLKPFNAWDRFSGDAALMDVTSVQSPSTDHGNTMPPRYTDREAEWESITKQWRTPYADNPLDDVIERENESLAVPPPPILSTSIFDNLYDRAGVSEGRQSQKDPPIYGPEIPQSIKQQIFLDSLEPEAPIYGPPIPNGLFGGNASENTEAITSPTSETPGSPETFTPGEKETNDLRFIPGSKGMSGVGTPSSPALDSSIRKQIKEGFLDENGQFTEETIQSNLDDGIFVMGEDGKPIWNPDTSVWIPASESARGKPAKPTDVPTTMKEPPPIPGGEVPAEGDASGNGLPVTGPVPGTAADVVASDYSGGDSGGSDDFYTSSNSSGGGGRRRSSGGSSSGGYGRSSRGGSGDSGFNWEDFLEDEDGDGVFSEKEKRKAKKRAAMSGKMGRGKRGGKMKPKFPISGTSDIRNYILGELTANLGRPIGGWPEGM